MVQHIDLSPLASKPRSLTELAALIAYTAHAAQTRKDDQTPYFVHPCMVAFKLMSYGFPEDIVAAGLVHDVLEDSAVSKEELERLLGKRVADIVSAVSEDKALPWEERKALYVEAISAAPDEVKAVSIADKIHNLESLFSAYQIQREQVWKAFNRGREQKCWFEQTLCAAVKKTWKHPILDEYAQLVERLDTLQG